MGGVWWVLAGSLVVSGLAGHMAQRTWERFRRHQLAALTRSRGFVYHPESILPRPEWCFLDRFPGFRIEEWIEGSPGGSPVVILSLRVDRPRPEAYVLAISTLRLPLRHPWEEGASIPRSPRLWEIVDDSHTVVGILGRLSTSRLRLLLGRLDGVSPESTLSTTWAPSPGEADADNEG